MKYPTKEEIKKADREQICRWHRFLPSPINTTEHELSSIIFARYNELGGFTPELSKKIGWEE
jgi:hypothetical protein